jgi:hypothetical protein
MSVADDDPGVAEHDPAATEDVAPPVGEEIHLPGPSVLPVLLAIGLTLALVGVTVSIVVSVIGLAITIPVIVRWVRTTQHDVAELPPGH